MKTTVDLRELAVERDPPRHRQRLTRYVLPGLLLVGFAALVGYAARETLSPPREVTVIPVTLGQHSMDAVPDTPLFRAAGWAEPRPSPTVVTALAEGVVEAVQVVEGQEVTRGQPLARLIDIDARLALEAAEAEVELRDSELVAARAALTAAKARLELPVHLQAELADADGQLARAESELALVPSLMASAKAKQQYAQREYDGQKRSGSAISTLSVSKAASDLDGAAANLLELQTREKRLPVEIDALKAKREAQRQKLARKVDEVRQLGEADAGVKAAAARLRQSKALRDTARVRLDRMEIKAPTSGRVLALVARPGTRLTGLTANSLQDSSTVLTMYDPMSLQVRVDVRLEDVGKVRGGQKVRVESAAFGSTPVQGEVLLATSQADIQKNTLSVKVAVGSPPAALRPEMLCQVTFLSPAPDKETRRQGDKEMGRMLVPRQLLEGGRVWVVDQVTGKAGRRAVEVGSTAGDLVEVVAGLAATDRLIVGGRDGLTDGARVRVVGEDESLGIAPRR